MTGKPTKAADVLETVRQGAERLHRHALVAELSRASVFAAAIPAVTAALRVVRPVSVAVLVASFVIPALALAAWALWRMRQQAGLDGIAHDMDAAAGLNDELLSAHWFAGHGPETTWTAAQVDRAADRAARVDWNALQPAPRPRKAWATTAVLLGLTVILLFVPTGTVGGGAASLSASTDATKKRDDAIEMLTTRLEETEMSQAERMRAKEILDQLQREGLSSEEAKALLAELEALLGKDGLDPRTLEAMADALGKTPSGKELADALRKRAMAEAAKKARELAAKVPSLDKKERNELADAIDQAANKSDKALEQLADEMRDAADKLRGDDAEAMKKSLEEMADKMDQIARDAKEKGADEVREQTEAIEDALGEQGKASEQGEKSGESQRQSSQSAGQMQGQGEGMARESASMPNPSMAQMPGLGQMAGQPQGAPPKTPEQLAEGKRRIEVALKEEVVRAHDQSDDKKPHELVDRKTERVDSTVQYRRVEGAQDYDRAKAQQEGSIPEARRAVVKKYFSALGPRAKKK
ncbi:MAG: hypothetical protein M3R55_12770 [Acidobacteriota bacterium]|nr:hypothetical protein [Acidobacteriota bacterium]